MKRLVNIEYNPVFLPTTQGLVMCAHIDLTLGETSGRYSAERVCFVLKADDLRNLLDAISEEIGNDLADLQKPVIDAYTKALADSGRDEEADDTDDDTLAVENCNS